MKNPSHPSSVRKLSAIVITAIGLALITCGTVQAQLVTNGGFEFYAGVAPKEFTSNVLPTDWSTGGYVYVDAPGTADSLSSPGIPVYPSFPATSPNGGNFIEADGSSGLNYPMNQTISGLTIGQTYNLSFYQASGQEYGFTGPTTEQWQVSLGSDTQFSSLMSIPSGGINPWEPQNLTYTANSTTEALSFLAIGSGGSPPIVFLDGVDMESSVPEPSATAILLVCLIGVGMLRLRRRARANRTVAAA